MKALPLVLALTACGGSDDRAEHVPSMDGVAAMSKRAWCGVDDPMALPWKPPIVIRRSAAIGDAQWAMVERSLASWEAALGQTLFKVHDEVEARGGEDFKTLDASIGDGINGSYFDPSWSAHTGKPALVLGTTVFRPGNEPEADIRYNVESFVFGDAEVEKNDGKRFIADLETVSLHEVGHLLGLGHTGSGELDSVMQPSVDVGEGRKKRSLSPGDVERIKALFAP